MRRFTLTLLLLAFAPSAPAQYDPTAVEPIAPLGGTLVLGGSGKLADEILDRFVDLAGGEEARIVVVGPSAPSEPMQGRFSSRGVKADGLASLVAQERGATDAAGFTDPLKEATGAWITGGDPARFAKVYGGTQVEKALQDLLSRGGVIGSNGSVTRALTKAMIASGQPHPIVGIGLDLLPGAVLDDQYTEKSRRNRLLSVLAARPSLVGLGIDKGTAMVLRRRFIDVLGEGSVHACIIGSQKRLLRVERINRRESPASQRSPRSGDRQPRGERGGRRAQRGRRGRGSGGRRSRPRRLDDLIALSRSAQARVAPGFPAYSPETPDVPSGTLVIVGGGGIPKGLMERFIELAGGPEAPLVYVPCSEQARIARAPRMLESWKRLGATDVASIHTKDRSEANTDEALLSKLRRARGIWFGGGRQWNLVDSYQNTHAHRLMHEVLARGGVIGGSSAGASIQASYMVRGNSLGNRDPMAEGYETGLGFITGVAIDQHFTQRNRLRDMTQLVNTYPELLGIGLDETAAIVVQGTVAEVTSHEGRNVLIYDRTQPVVPGQKDHTALSNGQRYDLAKRRILDAPDPKKK